MCEKDDDGNIVFMCPDCGAKMKEEFQRDMVRDPKYYVGKHVKIAFAGEDCTEHMWVQVYHADDEDLDGVLKNVPVMVNMTVGDPVRFTLDDIEDVS
jgi:uncharacterized protein YegJ (DUF2314 family)